MRHLALPSLALTLAATMLSSPSLAQRRDGVYKPSGTTTAGVPWKINEHHSLIWNGQPYLPTGLRISGDPESVAKAKDAGISDVIVDLPANGAGWDATLRALEERKMRYLIDIGSLCPMATGFSVDPSANRVSGITKRQVVSLNLSPATTSYVVLVSRRDRAIMASENVSLENGRLTFDAKPGGEIEHILLFYPRTVSLEQPDLWERLDAHRDQLLTTLRRHAPGVGFRGLLNPMGKVLNLPGRHLRFVPDSSQFRMEFSVYLEKTYHSVVTAMKSWSMGSNDIQTFDDLARLVPLWQGTRGVNQIYDPLTGKTYAAESRTSHFWDDASTVVSAASDRRFSRLVASVRTLTDVPVLQDWSGWSAPYETASPALDGIGMRAEGTTPSAIAATGSRAASSVMRWETPGWLPATDVDLGDSKDAAAQLTGVLDDLTSLGARGIFVRSDSPDVIKALKGEAERRNADASPASTSPYPVFFPENATNPAVVQRLPGNSWWLPAPSDGNRIDLGTQFFAYRMRQRDVGDAVALWARTPGRYRLRMLDTKTVGFKSLDGSDPDPKRIKGGIEVSLTEYPLLVLNSDEIPIPDTAYLETASRFQTLIATSESMHREAAEEKLAFGEAFNGFDRNPGGNFAQMRTVFTRLSSRVGAYTWIEGEAALTTNFSEPATFGGCSGGSALVLRTSVAAPEGGYEAQYRIPGKTTEEQEVWVAARIPKESRGRVSVSVNSQILNFSGEPTGVYGDGFGWYRLGTTRLPRGNSQFKVVVMGLDGGDIAIDSILLTPRKFEPNGVAIPDAADFSAPFPKKGE